MPETEKKPINGYKAFHRGRSVDVYATTALEAQTKAAKVFKAKKSYEVHVMLCEVGDVRVTHTPDF